MCAFVRIGITGYVHAILDRKIGVHRHGLDRRQGQERRVRSLAGASVGGAIIFGWGAKTAPRRRTHTGALPAQAPHSIVAARPTPAGR